MAIAAPFSNPSMTPTDVEQRRRLANALGQMGADASPVGHWTQALARVLQGGVSGYYDGSASKGEKEGIASRSAFMSQAMKNPQAAAASGMGNAWTTDMAGDIGKKVIAQNMQRSDPAYQAGLKLKQAEVDMIPLRRQQLQAEIAGAGLRHEVTRANLEQAKMQSPQWRMQNARTYGFNPDATPGTAEHNAYRAFVISGNYNPATAEKPTIKEVGGKLVSVTPDGATAREIYGGNQAEVGSKISGSLNELATIPQRYDSFDAATGAWQGGDQYVISPLSRAVGSVTSTFAKTSPSEVRRAIDGTSETLKSTIKDLIRKPGEGTWTDSDQQRLDYIVGDLKKANNKEEYYRGLEEVRRRAEASFGLKLPPLVMPAPDKLQGKAPAAQMPRVSSDADFNALPSGAQFMAPDGTVRRKP